MRFEEQLHWNDGLFLQPHHLQKLQRTVLHYARLNRSVRMPYPNGLIDFEIDTQALGQARVVVNRFSAVMPDGTELSMPGNTVLKPLNLANTIKEHLEDLTIYLAVPLWSEHEANLPQDQSVPSKRLYLTQERQIRDENSGDNEITVITRKINARLITQFDDMTDMQTLPLLRLSRITEEGNENLLAIQEKYVPPFMLLSSDCALMGMTSDLLFDVQRCQDKLLNDLTVAKFKPDNFSGINAYNILQLKVLNLYESRLSCLLTSGRLAPFDLYIELRSFLAELMGLHPMNEIQITQSYTHDDCAPQFFEIINDIRSLIATDGGASYVRLDFQPLDQNAYLYTRLTTESLLMADEFYLAIRCDTQDRDLIAALETGDNFKLINPSAKSMRARGLKLTEMRYPPRFLPALSRTLWFKIQISETPQTWAKMCQEQGIVIDRAHDLFLNLEASLFITNTGSKS